MYKLGENMLIVETIDATNKFFLLIVMRKDYLFGRYNNVHKHDSEVPLRIFNKKKGLKLWPLIVKARTTTPIFS